MDKRGDPGPASRAAATGAAHLRAAAADAHTGKRARQLLFFEQAARRLASSLDLDEVLRTLAQAAAQIASAAPGAGCRAAILEVDGDLAAVVAVDAPDLERFEGLLVPIEAQPELLETVRTGRTTVARSLDPERLPMPARRAMTDLALAGTVHVAIRREGEVFGVLVLGFPEAMHVRADDLHTLEAIAGLASAAITNAQHYAREQEMVGRLTALVEANVSLSQATDLRALLDRVAGTAGALGGCEGALVGVIAPEGDRLQALVHHGVSPEVVDAVRRAATRRETLESEGITGSRHRAVRGSRRGLRLGPVRSYLAVPMVVEATPLGVIWAVNRRGRSEFGDDDEAVLLAFAAHAAAVVANLRTRLELTRHAATDALTGLPNRRHFEHLASLPQRTPFSVLAIDIDRLKAVNDTQGHAAGDRLLRAVAPVLRGVLRDADVVARTGGDEFVALLPSTGAEEAQGVAERMRLAVAALPADVATVPASGARISVGCASGQPGDDVHSVWLRADAALLAAKSDGRDRVSPAHPPARGHVELEATPPESPATTPAR